MHSPLLNVKAVVGAVAIIILFSSSDVRVC